MKYLVFKCPHCGVYQAWLSKWYGRLSLTRQCCYCCRKVSLKENTVAHSDSWNGARAIVLSLTREKEEQDIVNIFTTATEILIKPDILETAKIVNPPTIRKGDICGYNIDDKYVCPGPGDCSVSKTCKYGGSTYWTRPDSKKTEKVV